MNFSTKDELRTVSVEGCELLGVGKNASVYRLDDETIIKVNDKRDTSLEGVKREHDNAHNAFAHGIPTAISYDIVKVGDYYGAVYELVNARTVWECIKEDYSLLPLYAQRTAELLRKLHGTEMPEGLFPRRRDAFLKRIDALSELITADEQSLLRDMLDALPERNTYIHGDYHHKNIMLYKGELLLIDMANSSVGHPMYDLMNVYMAGMMNAQREPGFNKRTGLTPDMVKEEWKSFSRAYLDTDDEERLRSFEKAVSFYSDFRWLTFIQRLLHDNPMREEGVARARREFFPMIHETIEAIGKELDSL